MWHWSFCREHYFKVLTDFWPTLARLRMTVCFGTLKKGWPPSLFLESAVVALVFKISAHVPAVACRVTPCSKYHGNEALITPIVLLSALWCFAHVQELFSIWSSLFPKRRLKPFFLLTIHDVRCSVWIDILILRSDNTGRLVHKLWWIACTMTPPDPKMCVRGTFIKQSFPKIVKSLLMGAFSAHQLRKCSLLMQVPHFVITLGSAGEMKGRLCAFCAKPCCVFLQFNKAF